MGRFYCQQGGHGNFKVDSNPLSHKVLESHKIPNPKHQITNKSQITIFNDQNIDHSCSTSPRKPWFAGDGADGKTADGSFVWDFEFRLLGFVWYLLFGVCNFLRPVIWRHPTCIIQKPQPGCWLPDSSTYPFAIMGIKNTSESSGMVVLSKLRRET